MIEREWFVYALTDPMDGLVGYVGCTYDVKQRIGKHVSRAKYANTRMSKWVKGIISRGAIPCHIILERGNGDWASAEKKWILHYRMNGIELANDTDGGKGTPGRKRTAIELLKMSAARKGKPQTEEWIRRRVANQIGRPLPEEVKRKISIAHMGVPGRKHTEEELRKMSAAQIGRPIRKHTLADREKMSVAQRLRWARARGEIVGK